MLQQEIKDAQAKELMYAEEANRLGQVNLPPQCFPCLNFDCLIMYIVFIHADFSMEMVGFCFFVNIMALTYAAHCLIQ